MKVEIQTTSNGVFELCNKQKNEYELKKKDFYDLEKNYKNTIHKFLNMIKIDMNRLGRMRVKNMETKELVKKHERERIADWIKQRRLAEGDVKLEFVLIDLENEIRDGKI